MAFGLVGMSIACWVALPALSVWTEAGEEVVWIVADSDEERSEEGKQGEEEAADDEVKKWSEEGQCRWRSHELAVLWQRELSQGAWEVPYRDGVFEPPEMRA